MKLLRKIRSLLRKDKLDAEMAEEMRHHVELQTELNRRGGMNPDEAPYAALRQFGNMAGIQERAREARGWVWLEDLGKDFRFGARMLRKSPGFTIVAVLALALGIGANTAIFSVVHGVLLRPLPYPEQDRLVVLSERCAQVPEQPVAYANFLDWRTRQKCFTAIGVYQPANFNYAGTDETVRAFSAVASHDLFTALDVQAIRGRLFNAQDDTPGAARTVIISEALWKRSFGGRDSVVGEKLRQGDEVYTIIGVLPAAFQFPKRQTEIWVPLGLSADQYQGRGAHLGLMAVARLKPGIAFEAALTEMRAIAAQLAVEYPDANTGQSVSMQSFNEHAFGAVRSALLLLLSAAGFVLLIACANVGNLQLARAHARAREFAVRAALGAGWGRVLRQLVAESLLLGLLGCGVGLLLGHWAIEALRTFLPANLPRLHEIALNGWVLAFAVGASLLTSLAFGLLPAVQAAKQNLGNGLAQGPRTGVSASGGRWRSALIVGEFALTCVLLVGAGLMLRTVGNLYRADSGYRTNGIVTFDWALIDKTYLGKPTLRRQLVARALERLSVVPGVTRAAVINPLPLSQNGRRQGCYVEGSPLSETDNVPIAEVALTSGDYFAAMGIKLVAGRTFSAVDQPRSPQVAVVDTKFAQKHFGEQSPIGRRFVYGTKPPTKETGWIEIVGVVAHVEKDGLVQPSGAQTYLPFTQNPPAYMAFVVQTRTDPAAIYPALRRAMQEVLPEQPIFNLRTLGELFQENIARQQLTVLLLGTFAALGLLLAGVGLYGVLGYSVGQRTREIGVRMALGATTNSVVRLVVGNGLRLAGLGLALGLLAALGLTHFLRSLLYGVSPIDFLSFAGVVLVLALIGALASWLPARRAAKVDPMIALRAE